MNPTDDKALDAPLPTHARCERHGVVSLREAAEHARHARVVLVRVTR